MSQVLIQQYLNQLQDLRKVSGTHRESVVREAFKDLLKGWARSHALVFIPEYEIETKAKDRRYVDGALLHELRMPFGYWEAKDEKDDLDTEIEHKFRRGYPQDNIIFEDSTEAVLIQNRQEVMRCGVDEVAALEKLLDLFFGYERAEIGEFRKAVDQFKADLPAVLGSLRDMIDLAYKENAAFRKASQQFLAHAQEAINPGLSEADVREMLIQHVLTEEIFSKVFGEDDFRHNNNVAKQLYALDRFGKQYQPSRAKPKRSITKEAIFHYVYGVLHDPIYREKYALNLKREFPRIPFYADFWQWADWGRELLELHIGYESVEPYGLARIEAGGSPQTTPRKRGESASERADAPKAMLKADWESGLIVLDTQTRLLGVPPEAWNYKLGNRSALEWILDQYKEKKPKDPTIREKFDTYRFADYKEKVIDLLMRVTRVSLETQRIVEAMRRGSR